MQKYLNLAAELGLEHARMIVPDDIFFDVRAILKCRWGCEDYFRHSPKCHDRGTTSAERVEMIKAYRHIILAHSHDAHKLSRAVLELERAAFLDGHYFAFAVRYCKLCPECALDQGRACPTPQKVRPCDQAFGIDVYRTARRQGLPCQVLRHQDEIQNRYGFVLID